MPPADAENLEKRHWMLHPFCLYLHLPAEFENAACLMSRGLRDQNLTARRARLDAGGQVYLASYDVVLHPLGRADVSYNHLPRMYADAHLNLRQVLESILFINVVHRQLHGDCAGHRPFRIIFLPDGCSE